MKRAHMSWLRGEWWEDRCQLEMRSRAGSSLEHFLGPSPCQLTSPTFRQAYAVMVLFFHFNFPTMPLMQCYSRVVIKMESHSVSGSCLRMPRWFLLWRFRGKDRFLPFSPGGIVQLKRMCACCVYLKRVNIYRFCPSIPRNDCMLVLSLMCVHLIDIWECIIIMLILNTNHS